MKGARGLVVIFKDGRRHEFNLKKETTWQYVFYLLKWIALFYPDHEKVELMRKEQGPEGPAHDRGLYMRAQQTPLEDTLATTSGSVAA